MSDLSNLSREIAKRLAASHSSGDSMIYQIADRLDLPFEQLSEANISSSLRSISSGLRESALRLDSERRLVELLSLCRCKLSDFQSFSLNAALHERFAYNLRRIASDVEILPASGCALGKIQINNNLNTGQIEILKASSMNLRTETNLAVAETYLLALISGAEVSPLIADLTSFSESHSIPSLVGRNFKVEGANFKDILAVEMVFAFQQVLEQIKTSVSVALQLKGNSELAALFDKALKAPGQLIFHVSADKDLRSALRKKIGNDPGLNSLLTSSIQITAEFAERLENILFGANLDSRPDMAISKKINLLKACLISSGSGDLSEREVKRITLLLQNKVDREPCFGNLLDRAFTIDYPEGAGRKGDRLTVKMFSAVDRKLQRLLNINLGLEIPVLSQNIAESTELNFQADKELESVLDSLAMLDQYSSQQFTAKTLRQALDLIKQVFPAFSEIFSDGEYTVSPNIEYLNKNSAIFQFTDLWWAMTLLDTCSDLLERAERVDGIRDWLIDYSALKSMQGELSFSDLAGAAPLFNGLGMQYVPQRVDSAQNLYNITKVARKDEAVELLPSGLHAFLSCLPDSGQANLGYFLRTGQIIIDAPSNKAIELFRYCDLETIKEIFIKRRGGSHKAIRLSQFT